MNINKRLKQANKVLDEIVDTCSLQCENFEHSQAIDEFIEIFNKLQLDIARMQKDNVNNKK